MSAYQTEEEQVEALKRWWKENGTWIIAGIVIGLGGIFGWQAWGNYQDRTGQAGYQAFSQLQESLQRGESEEAMQQATMMRNDYADSTYGVFAALVQARIAVDQKDPATAREALQWAMDESGDSSLKEFARLNLARVLLGEGDVEGATALADVTEGGFAGEFAVLRGDIAARRGDTPKAQAAYQLAQTLDVSNPDLLQMKLDDLALGNP